MVWCALKYFGKPVQVKSQTNKGKTSPVAPLEHRLRNPTVISLLLTTATLAILSPVARHGFVNFDDPAYVTANPHVQGGLTRANILWAFQTGDQGNWHPLTWLSHMLDSQLFGTSATGPHLVNLAFHVANTLLVFWVLNRLTGAVWRSAFVAALFGWHPLHVESVAWVAERKDVLSAFFFLLTLYAYARYACDFKVQGSKFKAWYLLALVFFVLGLMCKAMLVTLPCVLLLLDFWPLKRFDKESRGRSPSRLLVEKIPFFAIALASSTITFLVQQHGGAVQSLNNLPLEIRLDNAVVAYLRYLGKTFWPFALATPYSDTQTWPPGIFAAAAILLVAMTLVAIWQARRFPFLATGWFWFVGMLIPVIGIVQVGAQSLADRYTYLPLIGVFIIVSWGANEIFQRRHLPAPLPAVAAAIILLGCAWRTDDQLRYWRNSETLGRHTLSVTTDNWIAEYNLGWELDNQGQRDEAVELYRQAVKIKPYDADSLNRLGFDLTKQGNYAEALPLFQTALQVRPDFSDLHFNIANALLHLEKFDEAVPKYELFLREHPGHVEALNELGVALAAKGDLVHATDYFREALRHEPDNADAHFNLGKTLALQGKTIEAKTQIAEALRLKPGWEKAERELRNLETSAH